ncbi:MAG: CAP domain-containing protein [Eubacteriales bacterium]|nr:CAP domain-containing protein [Eubacteriales bacterium]
MSYQNRAFNSQKNNPSKSRFNGQKLTAILLCLMFSLSLIACGQKDDNSEDFELKPAESSAAPEAATDQEIASESEEDSDASEALEEELSAEEQESETAPEQLIEAQVGDKDPSTGLDLSSEPGTAMIVGNQDPLVQKLSSFAKFQLSEQLKSSEIQRARLKADDEAYAAELEAQAAAAAQAQAAAAYAAQQQAAASVIAQQNQANQSSGTVAAQGSAGIHDTYAGAMTIINLLNQHRASLGIHQLVNDAVMQEIALVRAPEVGVSYRATGDSTGHTHGGVFALTWIASVYGANSGLAENTGFFTTGTKTPEQIFTAFINSPAHYSTMVSAAYTRVGIALYYDPTDNREYVVMNFGN